MTQATLIRITPDTAEILEPTGWRDLSSLEWVTLPGGNFLSLNQEGYWSGAVQGFAVGLLVCLAALGVVAVVVAERMS